MVHLLGFTDMQSNILSLTWSLTLFFLNMDVSIAAVTMVTQESLSIFFFHLPLPKNVLRKELSYVKQMKVEQREREIDHLQCLKVLKAADKFSGSFHKSSILIGIRYMRILSSSGIATC